MPDGSGSSSTTPRAVPVAVAALFDAVIVKPMFEPASTVGASAVLTRERAGHRTVTLAVPLPPVPLVVETLAVFETVPQSAAVVAEVMWIDVQRPRAVDRAEAADQLLAAHRPRDRATGEGRVSDQLRSTAAGSVSVTDTPVAGTEPGLLTVTSKPIASPALTGPGGLAALVTATCEPTGVVT